LAIDRRRAPSRRALASPPLAAAAARSRAQPPCLAHRAAAPPLPLSHITQFVKQLLTRDGVRVVAAVRQSGPELDALAASAAAKNRLLVTPLADVSDPRAVQAWATGLKKDHGVERVGTAILNAGVYGGERVSIDAITPESMLSVFSVNALGPLLCVRYLREAGLIGGRGGGGGGGGKTTGPCVVAAVTSKMGSIADNTSGGSYAYRCSKSALNAGFASAAIDLAPEGVKCVLLHPGYVRTRMTGGQGLIDADQSVSGMLGVLEDGLPAAGGWMDWKREVVPW